MCISCCECLKLLILLPGAGAVWKKFVLPTFKRYIGNTASSTWCQQPKAGLAINRVKKILFTLRRVLLNRFLSFAIQTMSAIQGVNLRDFKNVVERLRCCGISNKHFQILTYLCIIFINTSVFYFLFVNNGGRTIYWQDVCRSWLLIRLSDIVQCLTRTLSTFQPIRRSYALAICMTSLLQHEIKLILAIGSSANNQNVYHLTVSVIYYQLFSHIEKN